MLSRLIHFLYRIVESSWNQIVNVGIRPSMPFIESRRTRLLNLLALPCIPFIFLYAVLNFFQERYLLSALNLITCLMCLSVLLLHKYQQYPSARLVLIFVSVGIYTFTGLYFHNGSEYFLLNILLITVLVYDNKWVVIGLSILIIVAFMMIVLMPQSWYLAPPVPVARVWSNIGVSLIFFTIALGCFKYIQSDYQRELERQHQMLVTVNKDKEKLFSIVAHDIRSPLATLESLLEMFHRNEYTTEEMQEATAILQRKISQLGGALDNVLRWSSRSLRGIQTQPAHFFLEPLVTEVLHFFQISLEEKKIAVHMEIPSAATLYADRDQVSVILRNLFGNALKFSHRSSTVAIVVKEEEKDTAIAVIDSGIGMPAQQMKTLFSQQQTPGYSTGGGRGTGLGLILCKEFVAQNHGHIEVAANEPAGCRFTVFLPRGSAVIAEAQEKDDFF
ncbi:HAMP domain-containing histidine kinase [Chitinophaga sp. Mgbs1]|uniref:histidine kinase n=1 Tax=Chitinophaga solisilvae TaxID=1233460 RepID=A0A9Q5D6W1_9BACT|nr:HAMP domain-containing histidine kinase [Chitinophaga solisilvae]